MVGLGFAPEESIVLESTFSPRVEAKLEPALESVQADGCPKTTQPTQVGSTSILTSLPKVAFCSPSLGKTMEMLGCSTASEPFVGAASGSLSKEPCFC